MLATITPLILTDNEAPNIGRCLAQLTWARRILIMDSGSTDETEQICCQHPQVEIIRRPFDSFAEQCNAGLELISSEWVLSLDADYVLTPELQSELAALVDDGSTNSYVSRFRYCVSGRPLRGTLYPPRPILFRTSRGRYVQDGHAHRLQCDGPSQRLRSYVHHDDRKPLARWLRSQQGYARIEAEKLTAHTFQIRTWADRLRMAVWPAAPAVLLYTLLAKGCLFDGWAGWTYALQRTYFELLLSLELLERRLAANNISDPRT